METLRSRFSIRARAPNRTSTKSTMTEQTVGGRRAALGTGPGGTASTLARASASPPSGKRRHQEQTELEQILMAEFLRKKCSTACASWSGGKSLYLLLKSLLIELTVSGVEPRACGNSSRLNVTKCCAISG